MKCQHCLVETHTHDLLVDATRRYQAGLDLPAAEWTRMVFADGEAWRARSRSKPVTSPYGRVQG